MQSNSESIVIANQLAKEKEFWKRTLGSFKEKTYIEYSRNKEGEKRYLSHQLNLSKKSIVRLNELSGTNDLKLQILLTASVSLFLMRLYPGKEMILGTPIEKQEDNDGLINTILPLFYTGDINGNFKDLILRTKTILARSVEHQNFPIRTLFDELNIDTKGDSFPLFDVGVQLCNRQLDSALEKIGTSHIFSFERIEGSIVLTIRYNSQRYDIAAVKYLAKLFSDLLDSAFDNPSQPITGTPLLNEQEKAAVFSVLKTENRPYPVGKSIPAIFEERLKGNEDKTAVACENEFITFSELDRRSTSLAHQILSKQPNGKTVMLLLGRGIDSVLGMLSVLKAQCAYVTVEIETPEERMKFIINDSDVQLIITSDQIYNAVNIKVDCEVININEPEEPSNKEDLVMPKAEDHCYTVYTSGSTGKPKGVQINNKAVVNHLYGMNDRIYAQHGSYQTMGLVSPLVFDACVQLTYGALLFGHKLQVLTNEEKKDGKKLLESYAKYGINISDGTPTHINLMLQASGLLEPKVTALKHIIAGGEVLYKSKVKELYELLRGIKLKVTNVYGPTECTVNATFQEICPDTIDGIDEILIGRPFPNYRTYILNDDLQLCPVGIPGELCFAGDCITIGYLNNTELNSKKIRYVESIDDTVYFTGDHAKVLPDGNIKFIGRKDDLVKIRGHRIELGEIDTTVNLHEDIQQALTIVLKSKSGNSILGTYYSSKTNLSPEDLRNHLRNTLPEYMIPSYLLPIAEFPLSANGKISKKNLPSPSEVLSLKSDGKPQNQTEEKLLEIWKSNLEVDEISVHDNYFNVGGDSIKTISLLYEINEVFDKTFSIVDLYQNDTINKFSEVIRDSDQNERTKETMDEVENELDQMKMDILKDL